jgi:hypothetical protein
VSATDSAASLKDHIGRQLQLRIPAAHVVGALLAMISGGLTAANIKGQPGIGRIDAIAIVAYFAVLGPIGWWYSATRVDRALEWLIDGRPPAHADRRTVLSLPWKAAMGSIVAWVGAATTWTVITVVHDDSWRYSACVALSILLGGLTT